MTNAGRWKILAIITSVFVASNAMAACSTDSATIGTVKATAIGIEIQPDCTYVLIKDISSTIAIDTRPFIPGRFAYIALDPSDQNYKVMLAVATVASAQGGRIYAEVTSRLSKANKVSIASEEAPQ